MKKLVILFLALLSVKSLVAQNIPNAEFELWVAQSGYDDPQNWATGNILSNILLGSSPISVFKETTEKHGGAAAVKIITVKMNPGVATGYLPNDTIGIAFTGKFVAVSPYLQYGFADTIRHTALNFYSKYTPSGTDTGYAFVYLLKRNGAVRDTIANGIQKITSSGSWVLSTVTLNYLVPVTKPDTTVIVFSSSGYINPQVGSTLYVDDVSFINPVGISDNRAIADQILVYPNPASNLIYFSAKTEYVMEIEIELSDMMGRKLESFPVKNKNTGTINIENLSPGIYFYKILGKNNQLLKTDKLSIIR